MAGKPGKAKRIGSNGASELVYVALGGLGEIGMNCYAYGLGASDKRQWLMVDLGITFPEGDFEPGVDVILPDLRFIQENRDNLAGLVITHAHEDHFGAVIELWPRIKCPVYATPFAAALLKAKLAEYGGQTKIPIREIPIDTHFKVGNFDLEFISVAHSIPEPQALAIRTEHGLVLHTGDWKLDDHPLLGKPTASARLQQIGAEGVTAMICDSTNALREGRSPSETDVGNSIMKIVQGAKRRVAMTIFSSNVSRIQAAANAAQATGRQLVVAGRAMHRMIEVAIETGHLPKGFKYHDQEHIAYLEPAQTLVLCTGSQGEPRAALARIADNQHPHVKLGNGDLVIFSSRAIPGNEKPVGRIQNKLVELGCELVTDGDALVHVTGHPRRDELKEMYGWIKPGLAIPMHGEARHMAAHAKLARESGAAKTMIVRNGDVVRLAPGSAQIVDEIHTGRLFRDGRLLVDHEDGPVRERRKLATVGIAVVTLTLDGKGQVAAEPDLILDGVPYQDMRGTNMEDIALDAVEATLKSIPGKRRGDVDMVADAVRRSVRAAIDQAWGKKPIVKVMVARV
jgi:ribonuclease J